MKTIKKIIYKTFLIIAGTLMILWTNAEDALKLTVAPANEYWLANGKSSEFSLHVHVEAKKIIKDLQSKRSPLNLSVVIDKSGSMSGQKMEYTKKAIDYLIDQLQPSDKLSLVVYDTEVKILMEPTAAIHKTLMHSKVQTISAAGSTNLSGGLSCGLDLVEKVKEGNLLYTSLEDEPITSNYIHRVFIMSDGLANAGITYPEGIADIANKYSEKGISVSTFGVGADFNEDLMTKLAIHGNGNYHFIANANQLPSIFESELLGISKAVAKNTFLEINLPEGMNLNKVFTYPYNTTKKRILVRLNDIFSEEQKSIVIALKVDPNVESDFKFNIKLVYHDATNNMQYVEKKDEVLVIQTTEKNIFEAGVNKFGDQGYTLMLSSEKLQEAMLAADNRDFADAELLIKDAKKIMEDHFDRLNPHPFLKDIYNDILEYEKVLKQLRKTKDRRTFSIFQKKHKSIGSGKVLCPRF